MKLINRIRAAWLRNQIDRARARAAHHEDLAAIHRAAMNNADREADALEDRLAAVERNDSGFGELVELDSWPADVEHLAPGPRK